MDEIPVGLLSNSNSDLEVTVNELEQLCLQRSQIHEGSLTSTNLVVDKTETHDVLESERDDYVEFNLDTLPVEVFLHICSFLEAGLLIRKMSLVSKHFYAILSNENTWKIRQTKRWSENGKYPPVSVDEEEFCWSAACVKREEQIKLWGNTGSNLRTLQLRSHIGCVDAVHLFQGGQFLASGSRDRSIIIWDVDKAFKDNSTDYISGASVAVAGPSARIENKTGAHKGWIWAFASTQAHLLSASWDTTVRVWDKYSDFKLVNEFRTRVACLCISTMENLVACGTFDKKVLFFDPRKGYEPIIWYTAHKKCVLALGMDENRVITCGEDGKAVLYDLRQRKIMKNIVIPNGAYPTCLSFRREDPTPLFYIGDKSGHVHLVDSDKFEIVRSYDVGHKRTVQGVFHSLGSVFTCSRDGNMKIYEPSLGLKELASFEIEAELPCVHSLNNTVALAGGDAIVRLWSPVEGF